MSFEVTNRLGANSVGPSSSPYRCIYVGLGTLFLGDMAGTRGYRWSSAIWRPNFLNDLAQLFGSGPSFSVPSLCLGNRNGVVDQTKSDKEKGPVVDLFHIIRTNVT